MTSAPRASIPASLPVEVVSGDALLRAEIYSVEQMEGHARRLATWHRVDRGGWGSPLLDRLGANRVALVQVIDRLRAAPDRALVPAADWLLDNQYLILDQITTVRTHLPRGYSRELPRLTVGDPTGMPRVYGLALEYIAHGDAHVDAEGIGRFVGAYQESVSLTMGELWAVPIMLRLALIENLRRIATRVDTAQCRRESAAAWAVRFVQAAELNPSSLVVAIADLAKESKLEPAFVGELQRRLLGQHPGVGLVLQWLEQRLGERRQTVADQVRLDHQDQAADRIAVANAITSLRGMGAIDWKEFVERISAVEAVLREDPTGIYEAMDFASRDLYRHEVEQIARRCRAEGAEAQQAVARAAISLASGANASASTDPDRPPRGHVGWWLVDGGRRELEERLAGSYGLRHPRGHGPRPLRTYLVPIVLLTVLATAAAVVAAGGLTMPVGLAICLAVLLLPLACQAGKTLIDWMTTRLVAPRQLPRLDFAQGIPAEWRTVVAVPTLVRTRRDLDSVVEGLEVRALANEDDHLVFVLLSDFGDAAAKEQPGDAIVLQHAATVLTALNDRHRRADGRDRFLLLHRDRMWNPREGVWMGQERKRGKIEDLNRLLLHGDVAAFTTTLGDVGVLQGARLVLVLDTDTRLPRDAARRMAGAMAHPLNRPRLDPATRTVSGGHAVLQPRAAVSMSSSGRSWYASLWAGDAGIDPYTRAVSDVYQDLFDQGSFVGKGIYDLRAFSASLADRFPDNAILSHDLIEGSYARSGLLSDVVVVEDHPATYLADMARRMRWVRGDWQLLPWLLPRTPTARGWARNQLNALARWKLIDNLRRSLVAPASLAALLLAWTCLPAAGAIAIALVVAAVTALPVVLSAASGLSGDNRLRVRLGLVVSGGMRGLAAGLAGIAFLPFEAARTIDAVLRTLWRLVISRRHLLRWQTASDAERLAATGLAGISGAMAVAPLLGFTVALLALLRPGLAPAVLPFAVLWLAAPVLAWLLSRRPAVAAQARLGEGDRSYLLRTARRTWQYFADLVNESGRWLPPDNLQMQPRRVVAGRTSPTNIGLALLADLTAHDFGWLGSRALLDRVGRELDSIESLERCRGHLLNWYDTATGEAMHPRYVSTVDSGNLAGHLLILAAGLRELAGSKVDRVARLRGCVVTVELAAEAMPAQRDELTALAVRLRAAEAALPIDEAVVLLTRLAASSDGDGRTWASAAAAELTTHRDELAVLAPGAEVLELRRIAAGQGPGAACAADLIADAERLAARAQTFALGMEWAFLLDLGSKLFSTGYHLDAARLDRSGYDLLASESRLTSYVAVAGGRVDQEHWFRLGRLLVRTPSGPVLASWSGTMFEYLMPLLVMPEEPGSLLHASAETAVAEQIRHGDALGIPWGITESAYYATDAALNWQYRAFGVPGLGLNRSLADDPVVAPYASALALLIAPLAALRNLRRLDGLGACGLYGFYEAVDFTTSRMPTGEQYVVIPSWMAHHQGMSLLACGHVLLGAPMHRRFLADRRLQAHQLLLQERPVVGGDINVLRPVDGPAQRAEIDTSLNVIIDPAAGPPQVQLLSNGRYHVMVTAAGGGYSRWGDIALTRWREDATRDHWGQACYLRDTESKAVWTATCQPLGGLPKGHEAVFTQARAEFRRIDGEIASHLEIAVSSEDDVELRRLTLANRGERVRHIEITTCAEPVLAPVGADMAHPAFSKLSVQTEAAPEHDAVLATRRPRQDGEARVWLAHALVARSGGGNLSWETDRERFLGRTRTQADPQALDGAARALSGTVGAVIDPVLALRRTVSIPPGSHVVIDLIAAVASSRAEALALCDRYRDVNLASRAYELSQTHGQVVLAQLGATDVDAQVFARLAGALVFAGASRRASDVAIRRNLAQRSSLWRFGISGDLPICLVRVADSHRIDLLRQLLRAHAWWRVKGLAVDLVVLIEDPSVYRQEVSDLVLGVIASSPDAGFVDRSGGVFVRRTDQTTEEDRLLLTAYARVVIRDASGTLARYVEQQPRPAPAAPRLIPARRARPDQSGQPPFYDLAFWNGQGGFTRDGFEYIILLKPGASTPAPWCNVLANEGFGTVVSERGAAYTWAANCHEFRLTPWHCDAVADPHGEAIYLRDEDSGVVWSPTPGPLRSRSTCVIRHGFGYSVFGRDEEGIASEMHIWVDRDAPVKQWKLRLVNRSDRSRRLTVTCYVEWTLAELRERSAMHLVTDHDDGVLTATNPLNDDFAGRTAFLAASRRPSSWTCDRAEFLGRHGSPAKPAALAATGLLGRTGAGLDPCGALAVRVDLKPGAEYEVVFTLGAGRDATHARELATRHRGLDSARSSLLAIYEHWKFLLGRVRVQTPDPAIDLLANGWLPYQIHAARMLARSGFSQSGGAYGFRDQLQDAMALVHHDPRLLRDHLVRAAGRQFSEGDVQHWWHPPGGRGVRTHISDDLLWLPYAISRYLDTTGDLAALDQRAPWLTGPPVPAGQESLYDLPRTTGHDGTLYEHAVAAIRLGLNRLGAHGLPLMGSGDWNDGMNQVGDKGKGESVWLAFFLVEVLRRFAPVARVRGEAAFADELLARADTIAAAIDTHAWDGAWYLRAWFDDGTPLGNAAGAECRIDALPQAWAAITGATDPERTRQAMQAVDQQLVRRDDGLIQLFDPPFDQGNLQPGYIKGYLPGVRENGGQYTHAAVWTAMAFANLGDGTRTLELARLINPVLHADSPAAAARWRVEPYVMAADVYRTPGHVGRGGWTWYTGSAGWMWRLLVESLLGFERRAGQVRLHPCTPDGWGDFTVHYHHGNSRWTLVAKGSGPVERITVDGGQFAGEWVTLVDDGREHRAEFLRRKG